MPSVRCGRISAKLVYVAVTVVTLALVGMSLWSCSGTSSEDFGPRSPCVGGDGSPCDKWPVNVARF